MRPSTLSGALALCAGAAVAFSDTSPFIFISTARIGHHSDRVDLQTAARAVKLAGALVDNCPTDHYLLVSQPHINEADLGTGDGSCASPNLCRAIAGAEIKTRRIISEVYGAVSARDLRQSIDAACGRAGKTPTVKELVLSALPLRARSQALADNDYILRDSLEAAEAAGSYSLVYFAGPSEPTYEADFGEPLHVDLRRRVGDASGLLDRAIPSATPIASPSLFEKYQFFTPGIFVGLLSALFLLTILSIGLKALGSLQVPYGAFEKEMGPAAQKKQQH